MHTSSLFTTAAILSLLSLQVACRDDTGGGGVGGDTTTSSGTSSDGGGSSVTSSSTDASSSSSAGGGGTGGAPGTGGGGTGGGNTGPFASCEEAQGDPCFWNGECANDRRCEDVGTEEGLVVCCVPGARGAGQLGDECTGENDCESSLCIEGFCSDTCMNDQQCPDQLPTCIPIQFSGVDEEFCTP